MLVLVGEGKPPALRFAAMFVQWPVLYLMLLTGGLWTLVAQLFLVALWGGAAYACLVPELSGRGVTRLEKLTRHMITRSGG